MSGVSTDTVVDKVQARLVRAEQSLEAFLGGDVSREAVRSALSDVQFAVTALAEEQAVRPLAFGSAAVRPAAEVRQEALERFTKEDPDLAGS